MKAISSNKPRLRFKDEQGSDYPNWKSCELGELATVKTGSSNRVDSTLTGKYTFFDRSQDIRTSDRYLFNCEAIIVGGEGQEFLPKYFVGKFDLHQRSYAIMDLESVYGKFIFYLISRKNNYFLSQAVGSTVKSLRLPMFKRMPLLVPTMPEQRKIADCLSAMDEKIEQLERKRELLEIYKKGLLQKLFSQEWRFKDENGMEHPEWKSVQLQDIAKIFRGSGLSKADLDPCGQYPCILYGELFTKYQETIREVFSYTRVQTNVVGENGDILMPTSDVTPSGLATASVLLLTDVQLGGDINIVRLIGHDNPVLVCYMLNFLKREIISLVSGTTVKHIYPKDLKRVNLCIPTSELEQTKIADFLSAVDEKIEHLNQQIELSRNFKHGLLQQLFV